MKGLNRDRCRIGDFGPQDVPRRDILHGGARVEVPESTFLPIEYLCLWICVSKTEMSFLFGTVLCNSIAQGFELLSTCMEVPLTCGLWLRCSRPSIHSCVRVNTLQTTTKEVIKQLTRYVLEQQNGKQSMMLRLNDSQKGSSEAADFEEAKCTIPGESSSELDEGPETCGMCFEHDVLDNVVMVKGRGPCSIDYNAARGEGGALSEVVVSRKCAEAVLRGAHVCRTQDYS